MRSDSWRRGDVNAARNPWDRRPKEPARAFEAFERFCALGPTRHVDDVAKLPKAHALVTGWAGVFDWVDRAAAWDDEQHRLADAERIEAIRAMHARHVDMARDVVSIAYEALRAVPAADLPAAVAVRLFELGTKLERDTLTVSVEELQGIDPPLADDPWAQVARELERLPAD